MDLSAITTASPDRAIRPRALWHAVVVMAQAESDRWLLWLPVAVALGVAGYYVLPWEPSAWMAAAGLLGAALVAVIAWHRSTLLLAVGLVLCAVVTGFAAAKLRTIAVAAPVLEKRIGPALVSGVVVMAESWENGPRVILADATIAGLGAEATPQRLRLRLLRSEPAPAVGQRITLRAVVMPPTPPALPGAYDFGRQAFLQRIGAVG